MAAIPGHDRQGSLPGRIALVLFFGLMAACTLDRGIEVEAGAYVVAPGGGAANLVARGVIWEVSIDRIAQELLVSYLDGSETVLPFSPRPRLDWPAGCPGNINSTRMEVLDLGVNPLKISSLTLDDPILVRNCPPDPVELVLREAGDIGGSGTACGNPDMCIIFVHP